MYYNGTRCYGAEREATTNMDDFSISGVRIGHSTNPDAHTGLTVFLCPDNTVGGADVRGPAPGTREISLLSPMKSVATINAVMLSGGSAFGLSAADGIVRYLAERNISYTTPIKNVPIVSAAIVYDLFLGGGSNFPNADMAYKACLEAGSKPIEQGNVGVGTGVTAGMWGGPQAMMKGGFGIATNRLDDLKVSAAAVVNSFGDVVRSDGSVLAGARSDDGGWLVSRNPWRIPIQSPQGNIITNTTLVVVITNARLDKIGANLIASMAQDGIAISVRPAHTRVDGDLSFALATGKTDAPLELVGNMAVDAVSQAIQNAVLKAESVTGIPGLASQS